MRKTALVLLLTQLIAEYSSSSNESNNIRNVFKRSPTVSNNNNNNFNRKIESKKTRGNVCV